MADYILIRKGRNILSSVLHIALNILLGIGSIYLTVITESWIPGIILVLLSKWRIFAVRPRYWLLNLKSNLVDLIVGISLVFLAFCAGSTIMPVHWVLAVIYVTWLLILKPRSSESAAEVQSLIAIFLGISAATILGATSNSIWLTICAFVIGYGAARHVLIQSDDHDYTYITFTCGLIASEIAWIFHSWLIVYSFNNTGIIIPQLAIIMTILAFLFNRIYKSILKRDGKFKLADVAMPTVFSILVIAIMIICFSQPIFNI